MRYCGGGLYDESQGSEGKYQETHHEPNSIYNYGQITDNNAKVFEQLSRGQNRQKYTKVPIR